MQEYSTITQIADLLNVKTYYNNSDSEEELPEDEDRNKEASGNAGIQPNKIKYDAATEKEIKERENKYRKIEDKIRAEEFEDYVAESGNNDWKATPKWDIAYRQEVTPSDVFLQMGGKTPSSISCEDMILTIKLPGESYRSIDLKIEKQSLGLISSRYKLNIPLPQPVDPQGGNAKWDKDTEELIVTLRMDREFDFIHF